MRTANAVTDWIVDDKSMTPRTNDAKYIECVRELYMKIGEQVKGQTFKDGGPIKALYCLYGLSTIIYHLRRFA